jgi:hypothetical protein
MMGKLNSWRNSPLLWLCAGALFSLGIIIPSPVNAEEENQLINVPMYRYAGITTQGSDVFAVFQEIFADKLRVLRGRFEGFAEGNYLERLSVSTVTTMNPPSVDEIKRRWISDSALEVMHGLIITRTDGYWVISRIYIGQLSTGYLNSEDLKVELRLSEDEYASIIDSHSLVTIFALAMDAKRLRLSSYYVLDLLAAGDDVYADLLRRVRPGIPIQPDLVKIHDAIRQAIQDLRHL